MITREALEEGARTLKRTSASWNVAVLDTELLLAHTLSCSKEDVYLRHSQPISGAQLRKFRSFLKRRRAHEPVAYIIESKPFFELDFRVKKGVTLIPRPDTEVLVERALNVLQGKDWADADVIDVGTGSGVIAVSVAFHNKDVHIQATDISSKALAIAKENAKTHDVASHISFSKTDLLPKNLGEKDHLLILANLPYVSVKEWQSLPKHIKKYEPKSALVVGADGLDCYRRLLEEIKKRDKKKTITLLLELFPEQISALKKEAKRLWKKATFEIIKDLAGKNRVLEIRI